jgi:UDP-N-acetylmuramyl pentapeptide phosphotransferase/UDP-N-acetylglucosamine-1-phosphate transferase
MVGFPLFVAAAPLALYIGDTGFTLIRRLLGGKPWDEPHRDHAYQLLVQAGWSHQRTVALIAGVTLACAGLSLATWRGNAAFGSVAAASILGLVALYLWLPSLVTQHGARR